MCKLSCLAELSGRGLRAVWLSCQGMMLASGACSSCVSHLRWGAVDCSQTQLVDSVYLRERLLDHQLHACQEPTAAQLVNTQSVD